MSTAEENKAIVTRHLKEVLEQGRVELIDSCFAPKQASDSHWGSAEDWRSLVLFFHHACPGLKVDILQMTAEEDRVVVDIRFEVLYSVPIDPPPSNFPAFGKPVSWLNLNFFRIADGKIVESHESSGWTDAVITSGASPYEYVDANKAAVRKFVDGLNNRDAVLLSEACTPEVAQVWIDMLPGIYTTMKDHHIEMSEMVADGDSAAVKMATSGYHTGQLFGLAPTGKWWTNRGLCFFRFSAGKISEVDPLFDAENHLKQLGGVICSASDNLEAKS